MKVIFIYVALLFFANCAFSQTEFLSRINDGDKEMQKGNFLDALKIYDAAEAYDPSQKDLVKRKRDALFSKIASVNSAAGNSKTQIKKLLDTIQYQKQTTQAALDKAEKLINAFYFYNGKYALAFNGKFGFIDKNGTAVIPYLYSKAEQFDYSGFARVQAIETFALITDRAKTENRPVDYLIDTANTQYKVVYRLEDLKDPDVVLAAEIPMALDLRESRLNSFPPAVMQQPQLKILILDGSTNKENSIKTIPKEIGNFQNLKYLSLRNCKMESLPAEIGQLKELRTLNLRENSLDSLPAEIIQLKELQILNLIDNEIKQLPADIGQLKNLQTLLLTENKLEALPSSITELKSLKVLSLRNNGLLTWPAGLEKLISLEQLNYSNNGLKTFPVEILQLANLEVLDFSFNLFSFLPDGISKLKNLSSLSLRSNSLSILPPAIKNLKTLETLDMSGNELTGFPQEILQLTNLETLDLSFNNLIKSVPKDISKLQNLRTLKLNNTAIPAADRKTIQDRLPRCNVIFMQGN